MLVTQRLLCTSKSRALAVSKCARVDLVGKLAPVGDLSAVGSRLAIREIQIQSLLGIPPAVDEIGVVESQLNSAAHNSIDSLDTKHE